MTTYGLLAALQREGSGLAAAGFRKVDRAVFERAVGDDLTWRVTVTRDPDEPPLRGEIWAGAFVPSLSGILRGKGPSWREPGVLAQNIMDLSGRVPAWNFNPPYDGSRFERRGVFGGRRQPDEVLDLVADDIGSMFKGPVRTWLEALRSHRDVAVEFERVLESYGEGSAPLRWAELGAVWRLAGDEAAAERAWQRSASMGREAARYVAALVKSSGVVYE